MNIDAAVRLAMPLVFDPEGCRLSAYLDTMPASSEGRARAIPVWAIGHGTTWANGRPVFSRQTCTQAEADGWAVDALVVVARQVQHVVHVPLSDPQGAALIAFVHKIGIGHFETSTVLEALNRGEYQHAADRLLEYDEAAGQYERALLFLSSQSSVLQKESKPAAPECPPGGGEPDRPHR
jgi:GH24 family phage-related lysozyme (muramidase)